MNKPTPFFIGALVLLGMLALALLPLIALAQSPEVMVYRSNDGCFEGTIDLDVTNLDPTFNIGQVRYYNMRTSQVIEDDAMWLETLTHEVGVCGYGYWSLQMRVGTTFAEGVHWEGWNQAFIVQIVELEDVVRPNPPEIS